MVEDQHRGADPILVYKFVTFCEIPPAMYKSWPKDVLQYLREFQRLTL